MYERTENLTEYHGVVAESLISLINQLAKEDSKNARKLVKFNIIQAYVLYRMDNIEERAKLENTVKLESNKNKDITLADILKRETKAFIARYDNGSTYDTDGVQVSIDDMIIDMFIYQSLAGIKPVQNVKQRARGYETVKARLRP